MKKGKDRGKVWESDRHAFKQLYDRYHKKLYFLAQRYLKDQYLAEDAVQDVFLKLWNKRETIKKSSIEGYMFAMMKNHLIDTIRKQKTSMKVKEGLEKISKATRRNNSTIEKVVYAEYRKIVNQALESMSPEKRKVFEMKSLEGLTNAEVAEKKNVSISTVKTQFYLGSKYVRSYLKKHADFGS